MAHQVCWTKAIVEEFIREAMLTKDEEVIMRTRAAGWTRVQQSVQLHMSLSKVDKIIARLKVKYDRVAEYNPMLPPRKASAAETYMDTH